MEANELTLWQTVENLLNSADLSRSKVEQLFNVTLTKHGSSNQYFTFWDGTGGSLKDGIRISRVLLRTNNSGTGTQNVITLHLSGECMTLEEVKSRYGAVSMVGAPRGRSEDEETTHEVNGTWGKLVFGFAQRNPNCLSSIGFAPPSSIG